MPATRAIDANVDAVFGCELCTHSVGSTVERAPPKVVFLTFISHLIPEYISVRELVCFGLWLVPDYSFMCSVPLEANWAERVPQVTLPTQVQKLK